MYYRYLKTTSLSMLIFVKVYDTYNRNTMANYFTKNRSECLNKTIDPKYVVTYIFLFLLEWTRKIISSQN